MGGGFGYEPGECPAQRLPPLLAAPVLRQFLGGVCRPGPCDGDFTSEDPQLGFQGYLGLLCSCAFPEAGWE